MFSRIKKIKSLAKYIILPVLIGAVLFTVGLTPPRISVVSNGTHISVSTQSWIIEVRAASESLYPTGQVTWTNLDGSYLDVDDDPDSPDGNWGDPLNNKADTVAHVSFDTPTGNPTVGAGLQEVRIWVKKWDGTSDPDVDIQLYESGVFVAELLAATPVTSTTGELFSATWNANLLSDATGASVEFYVHGKKTGGGASARATVAVGAVEWVVDYTGYDISNTPSSEDLGVVADSSTYYAYGSAPSNPVVDGECTFTVTNNGSQCDLDMKITDFTGGTSWNIVSGAPGSNEVRVTAYYSGQDPASGLVLANTDAEFHDALAASATLKWDFKFETGTLTDEPNQHSATLTITAVVED